MAPVCHSCEGTSDVNLPGTGRRKGGANHPSFPQPAFLDHRHSTPSPLTPLVGRAPEGRLVRQLVRDGVRLVTLHGPGGIGKTRLAVQLAADLQDAFPDGVLWVPLATLRDPADVLPLIAMAAEAGDPPSGRMVAVVANTIRERHVLMVLDNVEHVHAAAAELADLLAACPRLVILATSRSLLRIAGEHAVEVPPLAVRTDNPTLPSTLPEAVHLFLERSRAAAPDLVFDDEA